MDRKLIAIVPAAGVGRRAGGQTPKQYQAVAGEAMLRRTVMALLNDTRIGQIRVGFAPNDGDATAILQGLPHTVGRPCGGASRAHTVRNTLADALAEGVVGAKDWVLVHDAARPGLGALALARLIDCCWQHQQGGLLALPVADTVKRETASTPNHGQKKVQASVDRSGLWLAQTPQMFVAGELLHALDAALDADAPITDEASAMERLGSQPLLVLGDRRNFKVTWPEDFDLMTLLLNEIKE